MQAQRIIRLATLLLTLSASALAAVPGPATKFTGFLCQIDLAENGLPVPPVLLPKAGVVTGNSEKLCANGAQGGNIRITCRALVPDWSGGNVNLNGVPCRVSGNQCNLAADFAADLSKLTIDASGNATLFCQSKANSR
jgi:hypothetical protein